MKSLMRWSATVSLIGGVVCSTFLAGTARVLSLTTEQVVERLRSVPVFTLTNQEGAPLVASPAEGENRRPVAGVFISRQDAQTFLDNLKNNNPQVAQGVRVVPVSLAEVYQLARQEGATNAPANGQANAPANAPANGQANAPANGQAEDQLNFAFIPARQQVEAAMTLLRQQGQTVERFQGVPLFIARSGGQGAQAGYLTVKQGDREVIPMFFNRDELQAVLDRLQQENPNVVSGVSIQVVNLEGLIQTMQTSDNPELNQILLVPPKDSVDFVRSLQPQGGQQGGQQGRQPNARPNAQPAQPNQAQPRR